MTEAELIQNYAEVRQRLMGRPEVCQPVIIAIPPPVPTVVDLAAFQNVDVGAVGSRQIIEETATKYEVSVAEIKGRRKDKFIIKARHEVCYRLYRERGYSLKQIGKIVGGRDHTTVLLAIRRHELRLIDPGIDERPTQGRNRMSSDSE